MHGLSAPPATHRPNLPPQDPSRMSEKTTWELDFPDNGSLDRIIAKTAAYSAQQDKLNNVAKGFLGLNQEVDNSVKKSANSFEFWNEKIKRSVGAHQELGQHQGTLTTKTGELSAKLNEGAVSFGFFASAGAAAFNLIKSGIESAAGALVEFDAHATKAFGERTSTLRAYTTILGDATQAQVEYGKANQLASMTELTSASTLKAQQALIVAGFRGGDLDKALTASIDVASTAQPEDRTQKMEQMGRAFSQILAAGKLRGQELNQLAEAGVNRGQVLEILGKGDAAKGEKAISGGDVAAKEGIEAVYKTILQTLGTEKLGQFSTGASGSMSGELSNREEALDILLKSFDGETLPAVKRYTQSLHEQNGMLSASSDTGKGMVMMLSDFASVTANVKTEWTDFATAFMTSFTEAFNAERAADGAFTPITDGVKELGTTLGKVGTAVGAITRGFEGLLNALQPIGKFLSKFGEAVGAAQMNEENEDSGVQGAFNRFANVFEQPDKVEKAKPLSATEKAAAASDWAAFKERQANGETDPDSVAMVALLKKPTTNHGTGGKSTITHWPSGGSGSASGKKGADGGFILDFGSGGGGLDMNVGAYNSSQERMRQAVHAAGQASSAPSAQAQSGGLEGASGGATVNVEQVDIHVSGVANAREAGAEAYRIFTQKMGRLTRSPGVGRI